MKARKIRERRKTMNKTVVFLLVFAFLAVFGLAGKAGAYPITVHIEAEIDEVIDTDNILENKVKLGDYIWGHYCYDSEMPFTGGSYEGTYKETYSNQTTYGLFFRTNDFIFQTKPTTTMEVDLINDHPCGPDDLMIIAASDYMNLPDGTDIDDLYLRFHDGTAKALKSLDLPLNAPVLEDWIHDKSIGMVGGHYPDHYFSIHAKIRLQILHKRVGLENTNIPNLHAE